VLIWAGKMCLRFGMVEKVEESNRSPECGQGRAGMLRLCWPDVPKSWSESSVASPQTLAQGAQTSF
jgi:hypothetical protein